MKHWAVILGCLLCRIGCFSAEAQSLPHEVVTEPFPGMRYIQRQVEHPRKISMHIVFLELSTPGLQFFVTESNGDRPGHTDLETTHAFTQRKQAHLGINAGFFSRGWKEMLLGTCELSSLSVSAGHPVSPWGGRHRHAVNIAPDQTVTFLEPAPGATNGYDVAPRVDLYNTITGNIRLIRNGKITKHGGDPTYPQVAIATCAENRLIFFVADGRQPEHSVGMSYGEVATLLHELGAVEAVALDGGGSATLVLADGIDQEPHVVNRPSDGRERRTGSNLAVKFMQRHVEN